MFSWFFEISIYWLIALYAVLYAASWLLIIFYRKVYLISPAMTRVGGFVSFILSTSINVILILIVGRIIVSLFK